MVFQPTIKRRFRFPVIVEGKDIDLSQISLKILSIVTKFYLTIFVIEDVCA